MNVKGDDVLIHFITRCKNPTYKGKHFSEKPDNKRVKMERQTVGTYYFHILIDL
jgi:hypothetical protein